MNINQRQNLMRKIIADLRLLIEESWSSDTEKSLKEALDILVKNENLEGYDN